MTMIRQLCLTLILLLSAVASADETKSQWYAIFLQDTKIGHAEEQRVIQDGKVVSRDTFAITISRGQISVSMTVRSQCEETLDGKPLAFEQETVQGPLGAVKKTGIVSDGKVQVTTVMAGQTLTESAPYPAGALMTEGQRLLMKSKGSKPGTKYSFDSFDADTLKPQGHTITIEQPQSVALVGQVVQLTRLRDRMELGGQALEMLGYADADGELKKFELPLPGMKMVAVACDEAYARKPNGKFDLLAVASPASPAPLADARNLKSASFKLKTTDAQIQLQLPNTDSQTVSVADDGTVSVRTALNTPGPTTRPYDGADEAAKAALKATPYVQSDNAAIVEQARRIVGDQADAYQAAKALETFVRQHIRGKSMAVGYASALETLQNKQGDCTEHAVLLAALCRSAGIPCRLASGIVYTEEFLGRKQCFVGHEWNQAYIAGKWIDLDSALGVDAARITFSVSADDDPTAMIGMLQSLGGLKIVEAKAE